MKLETIAIHGGYEVEATTKAVAVPIYQTVAYAFDSAEHAAALLILRPRVSATPASRTRRQQSWSGASPLSKQGSKPCVSAAVRRR